MSAKLNKGLSELKTDLYKFFHWWSTPPDRYLHATN